MPPSIKPLQPPALPPDMEAFALTSRVEIAAVLRNLANARSGLTLHGGDDLHVPSMVVHVADHQMLLDIVDDPETIRAVLGSESILAIGHDGLVEVRFEVTGLVRRALRGAPVLEARLPERLVRLQRRDNYRAVTPMSARPTCRIPWAEGRVIEATIFDISGGGVAVIGYPADVDIPSGTEIPECRIALPGLEVVAVTLQIRHSHEMAIAGGKRLRRSGCVFVDTPETTLRIVQRYIFRIEAERRSGIDRFS